MAANDFIGKTWAMVNAGHAEIGWDDSGMSILIVSTERLAAHVLPFYFRHGNYASWVRGLSAHSFIKQEQGRWHHPRFIRGLPEPPTIRRKTTPSRDGSGSTPEESAVAESLSTMVPARGSKRGHGDGALDQMSCEVQEHCLRFFNMQLHTSKHDGRLVFASNWTFRQRFDAVHMMHTLLQRMCVVPCPTAAPTIRLNPSVLTVCREEPLACVLTAGLAPKADVVEGDKMAVEVVSPELPAPLPAAQLASQLACIAAALPQVLPDMLRDVSFEQLPPTGTLERQHIEGAIDLYFSQLSLASEAVPVGALPGPSEKRVRQRLSDPTLL
eukprot:CAMPEP_0115838162 /NCGR_PEP_ID=MMETSP0287-20121206/5586_1 /TAXON_ID=412157 /ORGANISM="Chrysochromulina rotalis, Strain UIO044" /LENGTH=326 /DNA_ID=CAMNT_0003291679 /DNA_START=1 /DNA_END=981 /DNA_ORIENTATION=+